jgi:hypothetical protein
LSKTVKKELEIPYDALEARLLTQFVKSDKPKPTISNASASPVLIVSAHKLKYTPRESSSHPIMKRATGRNHL